MRFAVRFRRRVAGICVVGAWCAFPSAPFAEDPPPPAPDNPADQVWFTTFSDVNVPPPLLKLTLTYGGSCVGQTWAFYCADWLPPDDEGPGLIEQWVQVSPEWTFDALTNQIEWVDTDPWNGGPLGSGAIRCYMAGRRDDADSDGLADADEALIYDTNPFLDDDWDHDGLGDAQEILVWGTDPKRADTDQDEVDDGMEVTQGRNPLVAGATADTDALLALTIFTPGS
jgi:hypothetical protein